MSKNKNRTCFFKAICLVFLAMLPVWCIAQQPDSLIIDNIENSLPDSSFTNPLSDSLLLPSLLENRVNIELSTTVTMSEDSLDAPVNYEARDSMIYDIQAEIVYLYGNAVVEYEDLKVSADYIIFDWKNNIATAESRTDSFGNVTGIPEFDDGTQKFQAQKLSYNVKTQKGLVFDVKSQQGDGYIHSGVTKIDRRSQTTGEDDVAYSGSLIYTTCNLDEPHFGIHSNKAKTIPEKLIVVGPSNVHIGGVPTPLFLPFGFYPIKKGQRSGLIFPRDFESSPTLGFGLRDVGYYFGISDYFDLSLTGNIYTRGTWGLTTRANYSKRYKYRGNGSISYSNRRFGQKETPEFSLQRDFLVSWTHSQSAQAHPSRTFSANMTFGTGTYLTNNNNDAESVLTNTLQSNVYFTKRFPNKPFSLTARFGHSQNTRTRIMNISLPIIDFRVNQVFPFQRKKISTGKDIWYERIGISYTGSLENRVTIADTLLFTKEVFDELRYGVQHNVPVSASFKLFKWFNISPSVNYTERWYLETLNKGFDPTWLIENDTIYNADMTEIDRIDRDTTFGSIVEQDVFGFKSQRLVNASISLNTQMFGTLNLKRGPIKTIRHVLKPSVSMTVTPDYTKEFWGYFDSVRVDTRTFDKEGYTVFDNGIYPVPPGSRSASMSFGVGNTLEAKVRTPKDSLNPVKKIKLLNALNIRSSYNFAADSLKFSTVSISGNTRFFKIITATFGANYDPYSINAAGRRVNVSEWSANKRLLRFLNGNINLGTRIDPQAITELFSDSDSEAPAPRGRGGGIRTLSLNYTLRFATAHGNGKDSIRITTNSLTLRGTSISLTQKWRIRIGNIGYDFVNNRVTYPDFGFYRDLHCWEMGLDWQPERRTYSFFIRVKPSSLDFLNIPYRRNQVDPFGF